ncbi:MAG: CoA pyrophosphatase [Microthrixaceae bacterium]|nr:CoA pyrophosphatase [Microthrixaceae bacterium]
MNASAEPTASERGGPQFIPRPETWRPGRAAPWSSPDFDVEQIPALDLDRVREVFPSQRRGRPSPVEASGAAPSAVLVAFSTGAPGHEGLQILLTRRAWGLRTHSGEMAFPGGRCELGEEPRDAAVREAWEETDLDPAAVETLGELDHLTTVTRRAYIVPQVAVITEPVTLSASPAEVDEILSVPVEELLRPEVFREEQWGDSHQHRPVYFFELVGNTVWGATAAILRQCLALLVGADPGSLVDLDPARAAPTGYRLAPAYRDRVV